MRAVSLIVLVLIWGLSASAQPTADSSKADTRRLDLKVEPVVVPFEVSISPGRATLLLFDSALERGGTTLEGREHFREVDVGERTIVLLPSETARARDRFLLTVHFADGQAPATALFILKAHPARVERQVEVYRHARPCETYLQQAHEQQAAIDECRQELSRYTAASRLSDGISELRSSGFMDQSGISARYIKYDLQPPGPFEVTQLMSYRSARRVAVEVHLRFKTPEGSLPWIAEGAKLLSRRGEVLETLPVRQSKPVDPKNGALIWVEAETRDFSGTYTLTLWDAERTRVVTLDNVQFP